MEDYKRKRKINKILDFLDTLPEIELLKKNYYFLQAIIETTIDFLDKNKNKNYKYYPWLEKIVKKKIEMYGV